MAKSSYDYEKVENNSLKEIFIISRSRKVDIIAIHHHALMVEPCNLVCFV